MTEIVSNMLFNVVAMVMWAAPLGAFGAIALTVGKWKRRSGPLSRSRGSNAYIMLAGTSYAHLHIVGQPVGEPMEHVAADVNDEGGPVLIESPEIQMARAIAAGPKEITDQARIMGSDAQGNRIVLREGNNDFICQPGKPQFVAQPATCYTVNSKPRITYMLAGATQRSISDPDDTTSTPRNRSTLDDHDAVRCQNHGFAGHLQYGGLYHVGGNSLCPPAHHGEAIDQDAGVRSNGVRASSRRRSRAVLISPPPRLVARRRRQWHRA
jgi:hypothetical protein